jgi:hypothetical protein
MLQDGGDVQMSVHYHVRSPFIAIKPLDDGYTIITIPNGCTIEIFGQVQRSGLVDVAFEGQTVAVFMRDIEGRAGRLSLTHPRRHGGSVILKLMESGTARQPQRNLCAEKEHLLGLYDAAANEFSRTVSVLKLRMGVLSREEYRRLRQFSEHARIKLEQARLDLEQHISEHGC